MTFLSDRPIAARWPTAKAVAQAVGLYVPVVGAVGVALSTAFNEAVFSSWGLSFTRIAQPSDVAMSGVDALIWSAPYTLVLFAGIGVGRHLHRRDPRPERTIRLLAGVAAATAGIASLAAGRGPLVPYFAAMLPIFTHAAHHGSLLARGWTGVPSVRSLVQALFFVAVWAGFISFAAGARLSSEGYGLAPTYLALPAISTCDRPTVMWSGSAAIVYRCAGSGRRIGVLYVQEAVEVETSPGAPAPRRPAPSPRAG